MSSSHRTAPHPTDTSHHSFTTILSLYPTNRRTTIFRNPFLPVPHPFDLYDPQDTARAREANMTARVERVCLKAYVDQVTEETDICVWGWIDEVGMVGIEGVEGVKVVW